MKGELPVARACCTEPPGSFQEASPLLSFLSHGWGLLLPLLAGQNGSVSYSMLPILWANWTKAPVAAMMTAQMKTFLRWAQRSVRCIGDWSLSILIPIA